jgi:hypothetical protein
MEKENKVIVVDEKKENWFKRTGAKTKAWWQKHGKVVTLIVGAVGGLAGGYALAKKSECDGCDDEVPDAVDVEYSDVPADNSSEE